VTRMMPQRALRVEVREASETNEAKGRPARARREGNISSGSLAKLSEGLLRAQYEV
jgi:hypothetical protein